MTLDMKNSVRQLPKIKCSFGMIFSTSIEQDIHTNHYPLKEFLPLKHVIKKTTIFVPNGVRFFSESRILILIPTVLFQPYFISFSLDNPIKRVVYISSSENVCIFYFPKVTPSAVKSNSYDVGVLHASNSIFSENY